MASLSVRTLLCPRCRQIIADNFLICPFCAYEIRRQPGGSRTRSGPESWARTALVFGILGVIIVIIPFLFPAMALHYGHKARDYGAETNPGMGMAGIVLGWVGLAQHALCLLILFSATSA